MMDCKKALVEADGDVEKAIDFLREKGLAKAAKKEGRIAAEGLVEEYHNDCCAALVEVNCETDFVAKTDRFKSFAKMIAKQVVEANPADLDALLASEIDGQTVSALQSLCPYGRRGGYLHPSRRNPRCSRSVRVPVRS